ncbi:MAG: glycosyltransferase family 4 protein [Verrucomicrobia bacterium]|nr:glycosyltransferase family 4 protein [Verrucomicrobiota bacterium]
MKKIWLLRRRYTEAGGAERFTQRLATMLCQRGREVWIAAEQWPESSDGVYRTERIQSNGPAAYSRQCARQVVSRGDGLIFSLERTSRQHVFRAGDGLHVCWLERRKRYQSGLARLWAAWNRRHRAVLELERQVFTSGATNRVIANSSMVKNEILERFAFPEDRIQVIHPGVDLNVFAPCADANHRHEIRRRLGVPHDAVAWCFVGSGFERKGLLWAIRIAARMKENVWLIALGKGNRARYARLAERIGFHSRLRFVPEGASSLDVYHASDAFILPTIYDPCSNATLEAAACGLPVITTRANGAAEWVQGIVLEDPSRTGECAERCVECARALDLSRFDETLRSRLDETPCWEAILQVIADAAIQR